MGEYHSFAAGSVQDLKIEVTKMTLIDDIHTGKSLEFLIDNYNIKMLKDYFEKISNHEIGLSYDTIENSKKLLEELMTKYSPETYPHKWI